MGTLNTLLDLASLGVEISMADKLEAMRRQGAASAMMQALLSEIRNRVFKYSETAKNILAAEATAPVQAAGAMRLLEIRLQDSGLTPEMFNELSDKEYLSNTVRTVRENAGRLMGQLAPEGRQAADSMLSKATRLPDYDFYVENYAKGQQYRQALPESKGPGSGSRTLGLLGMLGCGGLALLGSCAPLLLLSAPNSNGSGQFFLGWLVCVGVAVWGFITFQRSGKALAAKQVVDKIASEMDMAEFDRLDREFGGNPGHVSQLRSEAQAALAQFFGDAKWLTA